MARAIGSFQDKDLSRAACWTHIAAAHGDPRAQFVYSRLLFNGQGVSKNYAESFAWARRSAIAGFPDGESFLASLYKDGKGTKANPQLAAAWVRKASAANAPTIAAQDSATVQRIQANSAMAAGIFGILGSFFSGPSREECESNVTLDYSLHRECAEKYPDGF
jgi:TPR repeat protein